MSIRSPSKWRMKSRRKSGRRKNNCSKSRRSCSSWELTRPIWLEISPALCLPAGTCKPTLPNSKSRSNASKNCSTTLTSRSSKWKEKSREPRAKEVRRSFKSCSKISKRLRKNLILTRKTCAFLSPQTSSYRTSAASSNVLLKSLPLREAPWSPLFKNLSSRTRWQA